MTTETFPYVQQIARLHELTRSFLVQSLIEAGFSDLEPCHGDVFAVLFCSDHLPVSEIARRSQRSKSTISVMISRLERNGWVEKTPDPEDNRRVVISLTQKAWGAKPFFDEISKKLNQKLTAGFDCCELTHFESDLVRMIKNFS